MLSSKNSRAYIVSKYLDEKMKKLTNNVDGVQFELQNKIHQHIRNNHNQMTEVKHDIVSLRKETEEKFTHKIRYRLGSLVRTVSTDLGEKMKTLANNMDGVQLELQNKIEEHIGDNLDQMIGVKQDIVSLLKEMKERIRITREIRYRLGSLTRTVSADLGEKMKKLTKNVDVKQSDLKATKVSVGSNVTNLAGQLKNHLSSLEMIRSKLQELTVNTSTIQTAIGNIKTTADINNGSLSVQVSKLEDLKATVTDMNIRVSLSACASSDKIIKRSSTIKFLDI